MTEIKQGVAQRVMEASRHSERETAHPDLKFSHHLQREGMKALHAELSREAREYLADFDEELDDYTYQALEGLCEFLGLEFGSGNSNE